MKSNGNVSQNVQLKHKLEYLCNTGHSCTRAIWNKFAYIWCKFSIIILKMYVGTASSNGAI